MSKCPIPKLLTYNSFVNEINKIEIGHVFSVRVFSECHRRLSSAWVFSKTGRVSATSGTILLEEGWERIIEVVWLSYSILVALGGDGYPLLRMKVYALF